VTAAYIFLAIILAPALTQTGLDPMSIHMFLLYWGMLSFITPPVALASFAAASVANCKPLETGVESMRIGSIIYFIPFFFVFNPAFLGNGSPLEVITVVVTALIGITVISAGLQGYLLGFGSLTQHAFSWPTRILVLVGGLLLALPGGGILPFSHVQLGVIAVVLIGIGLSLTFIGRRVSAS